MTPTQIQTLIFNTGVAFANLVEANRVQFSVGNYLVKWALPRQIQRNLKALTYCLSYGDYNSATCIALYDCLNSIIGVPINATFNPNFIIPGQTIITVPLIANYNSSTIPFSTSGTFVLSYSGYAALYGNNPTLAIYTIQGGIEQEDEQTAPIITRTGAGISAPISTITLEYPVPTVGYILIGGFAPGAAGGGGSGGGGGGSVPFNFTEADLLFDAGTAQWYLPLSIPVGKNPIYVTVNGESISTTFDMNFTPTRLYSFADSGTPQTIVVNVL